MCLPNKVTTTKMKELNQNQTRYRDGEERPVEDIATLCSNCGIPAVNDEYCERCDFARLEKARKNQNHEKIKELLEHRVYHRTHGRTAQAHFQEEKQRMDIWTSDDFRLEAEEFMRLLHDSNNWRVYTGFTEDDEEFRKYATIKW